MQNISMKYARLLGLILELEFYQRNFVQSQAISLCYLLFKKTHLHFVPHVGLL